MTDTAKSAREIIAGELPLIHGGSLEGLYGRADAIIAALHAAGFQIVPTPAVGGVGEAARVAGAKVLAHTLRMKWEGLYPGKIDGYPAWKVGGHYNAKQGDYCDLAENIFNAMLPFVLDRAARLLSLREENARRDWQPIETAPKDGTCILIAGGIYDWDSSWGETLPFSGVTIASWKDIRTGKPWQGENCGGHDEYYHYAPTHWMPLPEPPRAALAPTQRKE